MHIGMIASAGALDAALFHAVNGVAGHHPVLDAVMVAVAEYSPQFFAVVLVALWASWRRERQVPAILAGGSALLALGIGQILAHLAFRVRPFLAGPATLLIHHSADSSFPSDHATLTFAVAAMLLAYHRRVGVALLVIALWVAVARVYVGAHYPGDVLGGAILGCAVSAGVAWAARQPWGRTALARALSMLARLHLVARDDRKPAAPARRAPRAA